MHDIDTWHKKTNLYVEWFNTEVNWYCIISNPYIQFFLKKDVNTFQETVLSKLWELIFYSLTYQISVWSLEGLLPLSTHFYKHLLYLMSKLSSLWNIIFHASVYDNAVTIELARPSLIQLLLFT